MSKIFLYVANRIHLIVVIYLCSLFVASGLFCYFENKPFIDGIWWACVTSLTIGYGDIYPITTVGRITGMVFGHLWIFLIIPMVIANIMTRMIIDNDKFTDSEQIELFKRLDCIQLSLSSK